MRVLVARAGALGDVLLLRPAILALREAGHEVTLLAPAPTGQLLAQEVAGVLDWSGPELRRLLAGDASTFPRFDAALLVSRSEDVTLALAGACDVVRRVDPAPDGLHAARWYVEAMGDWGAWPDTLPPPLEAAPAAGAAAVLDQLPERFVSLHPGSGSPTKNWPRFAELVELLAPDRWLLVEGPADEAAAAPLRSLPGAVRAVSLPLPALAAVLRRAGVHVGNDSGVTHLAAACATPTVAVFGPTDPRLWAPVGPRVRVVRVSSGELSEVPVGVVKAAMSAVR